MDVSYAKSGALSRAHYGIVRKIELATSPHQADQMLALEIKTTHSRLSKPSLSLAECKECLVILLYCASAVSPGFLPANALEFGLMHALNLAAAGTSIEARRVGYLFCSEVMPANHELRLLMVNTIRQDLDSNEVGRVCLGLENLISLANEDVVPAVRDVLQNLLSHSHEAIRRRAILALRVLSTFDPHISSQNARVLVKRLRDHADSVVSAALVTCAGIPSSDPAYPQLRQAVNGLLPSVRPSRTPSTSLAVLQSLQVLGMSEENIPLALDLVKAASAAGHPALLLAIFKVLSQQSPSTLMAYERKSGISCVHCIQYLLTSYDLNDQYLYLSCLLCIDPVIWAGTSPDQPMALESWQVERILQFFDSPDNLLRRMTFTLVAKIDTNIISAYLAQCLELLRPELDLPTLSDFAVRLLDIVEVLAEDDGENYGQGVRDLLQRLARIITLGRPRVLEGVVEKVLVHIKASSPDFSTSCSTMLLAHLVDSQENMGPTFITICSAVAVEQIGITSVAPRELLRAFCASLQHSPPAVQDATLVTILRLVVEVGDQQVVEALQEVSQLEQRAGRHIKKRCRQVLELASDKANLKRMVRNGRSSSLPNFLETLERPTLHGYQAETKLSSPRTSPTRSPKLRYAAYEAPNPVARLRNQRSSSAQSNARSTGSDGLPAGFEQQWRPSESIEPDGQLQLSLAAVSLGKSEVDTPPQVQIGEAPFPSYLKERTDLISLDSPFVPEGVVPSIANEGANDFEARWNGLGDTDGARGWCGAQLAIALRRLQLMKGARLQVQAGDVAPFIGEVKVILESDEGIAWLRFKENEEEGCLWKMRSANATMRKLVKGIIAEDGQDS